MNYIKINKTLKKINNLIGKFMLILGIIMLSLTFFTTKENQTLINFSIGILLITLATYQIHTSQEE